jgi:hypothetical protein
LGRAGPSPAHLCGPYWGPDGSEFKARPKPTFGPCQPGPYYFVPGRALGTYFRAVLVLARKARPRFPALGKQAPRWRRRRQARRRSRACWSRQSPIAACPCMHTPRARYLMAAVSGPRVYSSSLPAGHSILTVCLDFFLLTGPGPGPANGKWRGATTLGLE